jgi:hypothetical protein
VRRAIGHLSTRIPMFEQIVKVPKEWQLKANAMSIEQQEGVYLSIMLNESIVVSILTKRLASLLPFSEQEQENYGMSTLL